MDGTHIHTLRTRWRLPARGADRLKPRLGQVQSELLDGALEAALSLAGVREWEEVCVRKLGVAVRLRAARSDAILAADWAQAIAAALTEALAQAGSQDGAQLRDDVVRYGSPMAAWMDCALGVARGDLARSWAWCQLGLWRGEADASPQGAAAELVRGLTFDPESVVPVLTGLARHGALDALAPRLDSVGWTLLAAAALDVHGVSRTLLNADQDQNQVQDRGPGWSEPEPSLDDRGADQDQGGLGGVRSDLVPALPQVLGSPLSILLRPADGDGARPRVLLVLLAWDPALGRRSETQVRGLIRDLLAGVGGPGQDPAPGSQRSAQPAPRIVALQPVDQGPRGPAVDGATAGEARDSVSASPASRDPQSAVSEGENRVSDADHRGPSALEPGHATGDLHPAAPPSRGRPGTLPPQARPDAPSPFPIVRAQGLTDWGGVLLLLNLLGPAGILDDPMVPPSGRTLRWTLHRLALALVPMTSRDPAALAFAGLAPGAPPPDVGQQYPSDAELDLVAGCRVRIQARLHGVLTVTSDADRGRACESPEALLARICRRPAEILADPGWIEVRFPLAILATPVRRVGLDLDPGWLPWLGVVVRFVYE